MSYAEQESIIPNLRTRIYQLEAENSAIKHELEKVIIKQLSDSNDDFRKIIDYSIKNILYKIYKDTGMKIENHNWVGTIPVSQEIEYIARKYFIEGIDFSINQLNMDLEDLES